MVARYVQVKTSDGSRKSALRRYRSLHPRGAGTGSFPLCDIGLWVYRLLRRTTFTMISLVADRWEMGEVVEDKLTRHRILLGFMASTCTELSGVKVRVIRSLGSITFITMCF